MAKKRLIWDNDFRIPASVVEREDLGYEVLGAIATAMSDDSPSSSDAARMLDTYNDATPEERDAMNTVFVWLTGWQFPRLVAMASEGMSAEDAEAIVAQWKKKKK